MSTAGGRRGKPNPQASAFQRKSSKAGKGRPRLASSLAGASTREMEQDASVYESEEYQSDPVLGLETDVLSIVKAGLKSAPRLTVSDVFALARNEVSAEVNGFKILDSLRGLNHLELLHFDEEADEISLAAHK